MRAASAARWENVCKDFRKRRPTDFLYASQLGLAWSELRSLQNTPKVVFWSELRSLQNNGIQGEGFVARAAVAMIISKWIVKNVFPWKGI